MNLNPLNWFGRKAASNLQGRNRTTRDTSPQGPYTNALNDWVAREVAPRLYEALREAVPVIDAAINRLTTLDGIVRVQAESDRLQREVDEWMEGVRVGDMQRGYQAFYGMCSNELYEQGFAIGEHTLAKDRRDVARLDVADSKGVYFRRVGQELQVWYRPPARQSGRGDGTDQIERVLRNSYRSSDIAELLSGHDYRQLNAGSLIYAGLNVEAGNPYGVSLMRSMEFISRVLLTIDNSVLQTWERFGNPVFNVTYKTKARLDPDELDRRRSTLASNLATAMSSKREGKNVDFVNAVGAGDELSINVLGADGQVLEVETPARHVLEQIVAKTGLPSWLLGFHWSTAERLAQRQGEIVLQESRTRFANRKAWLKQPIAVALRARGLTWKPGDWDIVQELPSLQDLVAQAQAGFLEAQTELMRSGAQPTQPASVDDAGKVHLPGEQFGDVGSDTGASSSNQKAQRQEVGLGKPKAATGGEPWAEDGDILDGLERSAVAHLTDTWRWAERALLATLELDQEKHAKAPGESAPVFAFDPAIMYAALRELEADFIGRASGADAAYASGIYRAWLAGMQTAAEEIDADELLEQVREDARKAWHAHSLEQVRDTTVRALREDIIQRLADGEYNGMNPADVARALRDRFAAHHYDWQRLTRSELTAAHARGKMDEYAAEEVEEYDYITANDAKVSSICRALAAGGPYRVGAGPLPMRDSHPQCRCSVRARV